MIEFQTLHGRALAIGGNHFIHAARRNINMTAMVLVEAALYYGEPNAVQTTDVRAQRRRLPRTAGVRSF